MKRALLAAAAALIFAGPALAAVTPNSLVTGQLPKIGAAALVNGTLGPTVVYTGGSAGSKCFGLYSTNTDTSAETLTIDVYNGTTAFPAVVIATVIGAGTVSGTAGQALMTAAVWPGLGVDGNGNPFVYLPNGWFLRATASAVTSAKAINVVVSCQDF